MKNEIVQSTADAMTLAETFHKSGMFPDIKSSHMAVVKILAGQEMGISPFASMGGIHIIQGKATIGAGLMAARVKSFGKYDYKVVKHDDTVCSIDFYQGKDKLGNSTFTIDDARKAGTQNLHKFPKNMLFARALSNGVKWFAPDIYDQPVYVEGEIENKTEDAHAEVVPDPPSKTQPEPDPMKYLEAARAAKNADELTEIWAKMPANIRAMEIVISVVKELGEGFKKAAKETPDTIDKKLADAKTNLDAAKTAIDNPAATDYSNDL